MDKDQKEKLDIAWKKLTKRQSQVLKRILSGNTDEKIAEDLNLERATVRKYVERIYRVLDSVEGLSEQKISRRVDLFALFASHRPEWTDEKKESSISYPSNPFIPLTGVIEDPKLFFNRKKELKEVFAILNSYASVALVGERGIGKSSLLKAICREAHKNLSESRQAIYLNLQQVESEDDFYFYLCDELGIEEEIRGYKLNRRLKEKKLLLLIDEVETILSHGFTKIPSYLRGLSDGIKAPVRLVMAGKNTLESLYEEEGLTSPLINICLTVEVDVWDEKTIRAFIDDRIKSTSVTFSEEQIKNLVKESGGHPQGLMALCHRLYTEEYSTKG